MAARPEDVAAEATTRELVRDSTWRAVVAEYRQNRIAVVALLTLAGIVLLAVLAPWIAPQNPYDLTTIDVREGRQRPGSHKMTAIHRLSIKAELGFSESDTRVELLPVRVEDEALLEDVSVGFIRDAVDPRRLRVDISVRTGSELEPLRDVTISGLPRGAELTAGKKDKFRARWTLDAAEVKELAIVLPRPPTRPLGARIVLVGGKQEILMTYWLGTDDQGRDMLSAILYGLRISLSVATTSVVIALTIGTLVGLYAAFFGGRIDAVVMRLVDLQLSFPTILVALILLAVLGKGVGNVILALVIVQWAFYARTARGVGLAERRKEYVEAARCLALGTPRIVIVHLLPNCLPSLIVIATLQVAGAITLEATLSFLGLGLPVTQPSLGLLIANGFEYLLSGYPWISVTPGVALLVTAVSINLVGDELRDILNPRLRE